VRRQLHAKSQYFVRSQRTKLADSCVQRTAAVVLHHQIRIATGHFATGRYLAGLGSLGRPSSSSPMMLRCTCDEPA
jgi:hypothetical protein